MADGSPTEREKQLAARARELAKSQYERGRDDLAVRNIERAARLERTAPVTRRGAAEAVDPFVQKPTRQAAPVSVFPSSPLSSRTAPQSATDGRPVPQTSAPMQITPREFKQIAASPISTPAASSGDTLPTASIGDMLVFNGTEWVALPAPTGVDGGDAATHPFLRHNGTTPYWSTGAPCET